MGGSGSGRWGGRPTIESGLSLDVNQLLRQGTLRRGVTTSGTLAWRYTHSGEELASIGFTATLGPEEGHMRVNWTKTIERTGERRVCEQRIELTTTLQPFGGRRWWFVCPRMGRLVAKLYMPGGAFRFACREAYRLAYRSQRQSPRDRALNRAFLLRRRLGAEDRIGGAIDRPKGMRWATFDREVERIEVIERRVIAHTSISLKKLARRLQRIS